MLLSKHDNLLIVLSWLLLYLLTSHRITLGPFLKEEIDPIHCKPKTKQNNFFVSIKKINYPIVLFITDNNINCAQCYNIHQYVK